MLDEQNSLMHMHMWQNFHEKLSVSFFERKKAVRF